MRLSFIKKMYQKRIYIGLTMHKQRQKCPIHVSPTSSHLNFVRPYKKFNSCTLDRILIKLPSKGQDSGNIKLGAHFHKTTPFSGYTVTKASRFFRCRRTFPDLYMGYPLTDAGTFCPVTMRCFLTCIYGKPVPAQ